MICLSSWWKMPVTWDTYESPNYDTKKKPQKKCLRTVWLQSLYCGPCEALEKKCWFN